MIAEVAAWEPLCMEPDELAAWQKMRDRSTDYHDRTASPCRDCLAGFAAEMRAVGRCNGSPRDSAIAARARKAEAQAGA